MSDDDEYDKRPHYDEGYEEDCRYCGVYSYSRNYQHGKECPVTLIERIKALEKLVHGLTGPWHPRGRGNG